MPKLLVLFVYHIYNKRVQHFINKCIFQDPDIDFVVISNNGTPPPPQNIPPYVKTFTRQNVGYDFGGWSEALLSTNLYENYEQFIFVNSSVIGPFFRPGISVKWTDVYLNGLQGNVKLFGSTINTCNRPTTLAHVQSYIFSMNKETLKYLIECEIFSTTKYASTFHKAIWEKEVEMSRKIIEKGWNIGSLMLQYQGVDFTFKSKPVSEYRGVQWLDEIMQTQFRNIIWNEYQLVFIKGNRLKIDSTEDLKQMDKNPTNIVNKQMNVLASTNKVMKVPMNNRVTVPVPYRKQIKLFVGKI